MVFFLYINLAVSIKRHSPLLLAAMSLTLVLSLASGPTTSAHGAHEPDPVVISGQLLDLECYIAHQVTGQDNELCAGHHEDGQRVMALLSDDGRLLILQPSHRNPVPLDQARNLNGRRATVTGVLTERNHILLLELQVIRLNEESP